MLHLFLSIKLQAVIRLSCFPFLKDYCSVLPVIKCPRPLFIIFNFFDFLRMDNKYDTCCTIMGGSRIFHPDGEYDQINWFPTPKKGNAKECSSYHTTALISHAGKVALKILEARLQQYMNHELSDVQAGFKKGRGTRDQIANIRWITDKAREFQKKHILLLYWLC